MSAALNAIVDKYVATMLDDYPTFATFLGVHDRDGELGEFTSDAQNEKNQHRKDILAELESLDLADEPTDVVVDAAALRASLRRAIFEHEELRTH